MRPSNEANSSGRLGWSTLGVKPFLHDMSLPCTVVKESWSCRHHALLLLLSPTALRAHEARRVLAKRVGAHTREAQRIAYGERMSVNVGRHRQASTPRRSTVGLAPLTAESLVSNSRLQTRPRPEFDHTPSEFGQCRRGFGATSTSMERMCPKLPRCCPEAWPGPVPPKAMEMKPKAAKIARPWSNTSPNEPNLTDIEPNHEQCDGPLEALHR